MPVCSCSNRLPFCLPELLFGILCLPLLPPLLAFRLHLICIFLQTSFLLVFPVDSHTITNLFIFEFFFHFLNFYSCSGLTLCNGELWSILVVRLAHSADLRSWLRHVSGEPSVAYSRGVQFIAAFYNLVFCSTPLFFLISDSSQICFLLLGLHFY